MANAGVEYMVNQVRSLTRPNAFTGERSTATWSKPLTDFVAITNLATKSTEAQSIFVFLCFFVTNLFGLTLRADAAINREAEG
jgi:hypothetical protein